MLPRLTGGQTEGALYDSFPLREGGFGEERPEYGRGAERWHLLLRGFDSSILVVTKPPAGAFLRCNDTDTDETGANDG